MTEPKTDTVHPKRGLHILQVVLLVLIVLMLGVPLFIIIYNHIPPLYIPGTEWRIDHVLTFSAVFISVYYLARRIRHILFLVFATGLFTMMVLTLMGRYSFPQLVNDYRKFIFSINHSAIQFKFQEAENPEDNVFPHASEFRNAIDYRNSLVRNYAAEVAVKHFDDYHYSGDIRILQYFSVFKEIRKRWRYVYDPTSGDYFASASETVSQLRTDGKFKGDCDDYSILMAACIKAIGGQVKLVRTQVNSGGMLTGHVYPEVFVGNKKDLENINYLIHEALFVKESKDKPIYYHVDASHNVWLNFDYNDYYPGGKYQSTVRMGELII